ncbi:MAG: FkbM family methyltransferase [Planctomycetota bacterium]|jgi:FkbM family methyltransferase
MLLKRFRKHKNEFREYGFEIKSFHLPKDGTVEYAQWLHPSEKPKEIRQDTIDSVRKFVSEGDTVIDIGAHTGDTTVPMAIAAGASGCTLALEPNPYVYKILEKNAGLNTDKTNIIPLNFAATEADGTFTFHYSDSGYCNGGYLSQIKNQRHGHRHQLEVQGLNLEKFLRDNYTERLQRLTYVKIDTEGYDKQVIVSVMSIIQDYKPVILTEVLRKLVKSERQELYDVLEGAGYDCFDYVGGPNCQGQRVLREDLMKWYRKPLDILAIPR